MPVAECVDTLFQIEFGHISTIITEHAGFKLGSDTMPITIDGVRKLVGGYSSLPQLAFT